MTPLLAIPFPVIDPVLIEIGPLAIRWYSLAYVFGLLIGWRYLISLARKGPGAMTPGDVDDFLLWATLGVILGGRFGYVTFYNLGFFLDNPLQIFAVWQGGMSFHGGLIGVIVAMALFCRARGLEMLRVSDMLVLVAPIGLFLGRLANFINGELYGRVSDVPWAMVFPRGGPAPRHPSQLYEALGEGLLLVLVLYGVSKFGRGFDKPGLLTGLFFAGYGAARTAAEFFREPDAHLGFLYGGITMGQILTVPFFLIGIYFVAKAYRRP